MVNSDLVQRVHSFFSSPHQDRGTPCHVCDDEQMRRLWRVQKKRTPRKKGRNGNVIAPYMERAVSQWKGEENYWIMHYYAKNIYPCICPCKYPSPLTMCAAAPPFSVCRNAFVIWNTRNVVLPRRRDELWSRTEKGSCWAPSKPTQSVRYVVSFHWITGRYTFRWYLISWYITLQPFAALWRVFDYDGRWCPAIPLVLNALWRVKFMYRSTYQGLVWQVPVYHF